MCLLFTIINNWIKLVVSHFKIVTPIYYCLSCVLGFQICECRRCGSLIHHLLKKVTNFLTKTIMMHLQEESVQLLSIRLPLNVITMVLVWPQILRLVNQPLLQQLEPLWLLEKWSSSSMHVYYGNSTIHRSSTDISFTTSVNINCSSSHSSIIQPFTFVSITKMDIIPTFSSIRSLPAILLVVGLRLNLLPLLLLSFRFLAIILFTHLLLAPILYHLQLQRLTQWYPSIQVTQWEQSTQPIYPKTINLQKIMTILMVPVWLLSIRLPRILMNMVIVWLASLRLGAPLVGHP